MQKQPNNEPVVPGLTKTDFERPRTQAELRRWVDQVQEEFTRTQFGVSALRLRHHGLIREFREEVWALALYADAFFKGRSDVVFRPKVGNQSFDAELVDASSGRVLNKFEITQAIDGHQTHLRMLHLQKFGRAPVSGVKLPALTREGSVSETWPEAVLHESALEKTLTRIATAVNRKAAKEYPKGIVLIVEFEDVYVQSIEDRRRVIGALDSLQRSAASQFPEIGLVSDVQRLAFRAPPGSFREGAEGS